MSRHSRSGFTIIEVTLFVAISGVLAAALLVGWSASIQSQRYKDSVDTTLSFMQQQYNLVQNVENGRTSELSCNDGDITDTGPGTPRGQSDCVLYGRYVWVDDDGTTIRSAAIIGNDADAHPENTIAWVEELKVVDSDIGLSETRLNIPWGVVARQPMPNPSDVSDLKIAIVRTPVSGVVSTFRVASVNGDQSLELLRDEGDSEGVPISQLRPSRLCLDPDTPGQTRQAIMVRMLASTQSSVEISTEENGCNVPTSSILSV